MKKSINSDDSFLQNSDIPLSDPWNYEATVTKVETIIKQIEAGELDLAEVFDQFAAAVKYLRQCETFLEHRHQQMNLLVETLADDPESF